MVENRFSCGKCVLVVEQPYIYAYILFAAGLLHPLYSRL